MSECKYFYLHRKRLIMLIKKWQQVSFKRAAPIFYKNWSLKYTDEEIESMKLDLFTIEEVPNWVITEESEFLLSSNIIDFKDYFTYEEFKIIKPEDKIPENLQLFTLQLWNA